MGPSQSNNRKGSTQTAGGEIQPPINQDAHLDLLFNEQIGSMGEYYDNYDYYNFGFGFPGNYYSYGVDRCDALRMGAKDFFDHGVITLPHAMENDEYLYQSCHYDILNEVLNVCGQKFDCDNEEGEQICFRLNGKSNRLNGKSNNFQVVDITETAYDCGDGEIGFTVKSGSLQAKCVTLNGPDEGDSSERLERTIHEISLLDRVE